MTKNDDMIGERVRIIRSLERYPLPDSTLIGLTGLRADWRTGTDKHTTHWLVAPDDSPTSVAAAVWIWVKNFARIKGKANSAVRTPANSTVSEPITAASTAEPSTAAFLRDARQAPTPTVSRAERQTIPKDLQFRVWSRDAWHCRYCLRPIFFAPTLRELDRRAPGRGYYHRNGREGAMLGLLQMGWSSADHFVPVTRGGQNTEDNLVAACMECNITRGSEAPERKLRDLREVPTQIRAIGWDGFAGAYPALVSQEDEWCRVIARHS